MSSTMSPQEQLALAVEFRVPIPQDGVGGYAEVVVHRDGAGDGWAVTDGALVGLRAWTDGEGWRYVGDVGRAAAYRHTREEALTLAHHVAALEALSYQAQRTAGQISDTADGTAHRPGGVYLEETDGASHVG